MLCKKIHQRVVKAPVQDSHVQNADQHCTLLVCADGQTLAIYTYWQITHIQMQPSLNLLACVQMENQRLYTIIDRLNTRGSDHLSDTASQLSDLSSYAPREVCHPRSCHLDPYANAGVAWLFLTLRGCLSSWYACAWARHKFAEQVRECCRRMCGETLRSLSRGLRTRSRACSGRSTCQARRLPA